MFVYIFFCVFLYLLLFVYPVVIARHNKRI